MTYTYIKLQTWLPAGAAKQICFWGPLTGQWKERCCDMFSSNPKQSEPTPNQTQSKGNQNQTKNEPWQEIRKDFVIQPVLTESERNNYPNEGKPKQPKANQKQTTTNIKEHLPKRRQTKSNQN